MTTHDHWTNSIVSFMKTSGYYQLLTSRRVLTFDAALNGESEAGSGSSSIETEQDDPLVKLSSLIIALSLTMQSPHLSQTVGSRCRRCR